MSWFLAAPVCIVCDIYWVRLAYKEDGFNQNAAHPTFAQLRSWNNGSREYKKWKAKPANEIMLQIMSRFILWLDHWHSLCQVYDFENESIHTNIRKIVELCYSRGAFYTKVLIEYWRSTTRMQIEDNGSQLMFYSKSFFSTWKRLQIATNMVLRLAELNNAVNEKVRE